MSTNSTTTTETTTETPQTPATSPITTEQIEVAEEAGYDEEIKAIASELFDNLGDESDGLETSEEGGISSQSSDGSPVTPATLTPEATPAAAQTPTGSETSAVPAPGADAAPAAATPAATPPGEAAPAQGQQPAAQAAAPATTTPQSGTEFLEDVGKKLAESEASYIEALATSTYGMTEEEASAVLTEPEKVLPMLAAKAHVTIVRNVMASLAQVIPGVVAGVTEARKQSNDVLDKFFAEHPALDREKDYQTVLQFAQLYRQQNPNADFETMSKTVGTMAMVHLGRSPSAAPAAAPAAPAAAAPVATYSPAGRATPVSPTPAPSSPWEGIAELLEE